MDALEIDTRGRRGRDVIREGGKKHPQAALGLRVELRSRMQIDQIGMYYDVDDAVLLLGVTSA
jgi:hypothetical protein